MGRETRKWNYSASWFLVYHDKTGGNSRNSYLPKSKYSFSLVEFVVHVELTVKTFSQTMMQEEYGKKTHGTTTSGMFHARTRISLKGFAWFVLFVYAWCKIHKLNKFSGMDFHVIFCTYMYCFNHIIRGWWKVFLLHVYNELNINAKPGNYILA